MTTKRIATPYLPSGKEIKFVFDGISDDENGAIFFLEKKKVALIPFSVPIIFEDYSEPSAEPTPITLGAGTQGAKWVTIDQMLVNAILEKHQPITPLTDLSDYKNIIGGVDMTDTHKMD